MDIFGKLFGAVGNAFTGVVGGVERILNSEGVEAAIAAGAQYAADKQLNEDEKKDIEEKDASKFAIPSWLLPAGLLLGLLLILTLVFKSRK